jgi:hypothetical protein
MPKLEYEEQLGNNPVLGPDHKAYDAGAQFQGCRKHCHQNGIFTYLLHNSSVLCLHTRAPYFHYF